MTTLQVTVVAIWGVIAFGAVYIVGATFGGARMGLELVLAIVVKLTFFASIGALLYFTLKAISQAF